MEQVLTLFLIPVREDEKEKKYWNSEDPNEELQNGDEVTKIGYMLMELEL